MNKQEMHAALSEAQWWFHQAHVDEYCNNQSCVLCKRMHKLEADLAAIGVPVPSSVGSSNPATLREALKHFSVTNGTIRFELYGVPMNVEASADVVKDGPARIGAFHRLIAALAASGTEAAPNPGIEGTAEDKAEIYWNGRKPVPAQAAASPEAAPACPQCGNPRGDGVRNYGEERHSMYCPKCGYTGDGQ